MVRWWLFNGGYKTLGEILMAIKVGYSFIIFWGS